MDYHAIVDAEAYRCLRLQSILIWEQLFCLLIENLLILAWDRVHDQRMLAG